jgi:hypothetical protein
MVLRRPVELATVIGQAGLARQEIRVATVEFDRGKSHAMPTPFIINALGMEKVARIVTNR